VARIQLISALVFDIHAVRDGGKLANIKERTMHLDTILVIGIVIGAAFYLYHKFVRKSSKGGCSGDGCCGGKRHTEDKKCCAAK